jgi:hypothetical protein
MSGKEKAARECGLKALSDYACKNICAPGYRQPRGLNAYEQLRLQWIELNPIHTEAELAAACVLMARNCGLILLNQLKGAHLHGEAEKTS